MPLTQPLIKEGLFVVGEAGERVASRVRSPVGRSLAHCKWPISPAAINLIKNLMN